MQRPSSSYHPRHPAHAWALSQAWAHQPAGEPGKDWLVERGRPHDDDARRRSAQPDPVPRPLSHALCRYGYYARPVRESYAYGPAWAGLRALPVAAHYAASHVLAAGHVMYLRPGPDTRHTRTTYGADWPYQESSFATCSPLPPQHTHPFAHHLTTPSDPATPSLETASAEVANSGGGGGTQGEGRKGKSRRKFGFIRANIALAFLKNECPESEKVCPCVHACVLQTKPEPTP
jgi:hypothetical protein